jgi:tRNA 5-methylaminomethyl-2-thiouridine biosynthesis bifunctional protein
MQLNPHIEWRDGQPYAREFQDVYFSTDHGLQETEYVFLQGNALTERWQNLTHQTFTIAETGFGTGLNFLCAAKLWLALAPNNAQLHFISTEKYPLSQVDITQALALWPELSQISTPLLTEYTHAIQSGTPLLLFESRIKLSLLIGDATLGLQALNLHHTSVDAWFLDGFSPAKNPDMWQPALFAQIAALSNTQSTFATFTSAGDVRRGLIAAGFAVQKKTGFGKKREMLTGSMVKPIGDAHDT